METKFTKGPWKVTGFDGLGYCIESNERKVIVAAFISKVIKCYKALLALKVIQQLCQNFDLPLQAKCLFLDNSDIIEKQVSAASSLEIRFHY